jgi:hypothetical protein
MWATVLMITTVFVLGSIFSAWSHWFPDQVND